jgi:hypothetical protein
MLKNWSKSYEKLKILNQSILIEFYLLNLNLMVAKLDFEFLPLKNAFPWKQLQILLKL